MILADKITEERKKNGWSQEELANQLGVSRQAVSKWESAGAVPDLQRILQMSELFGVSTDYLLKDEMKAENITYHESTESYAEPLKKVTMENANEFLDMKRNGSKVVANATSMCISSPILLIVLVTMAEDGVFHVSESLATVFGCVFCLEWLRQPSFCLLHMECVNHIWNILKKNALKQSMVYLEWYEKKKIPMNRFLSEEQLLG
ncbi:MAG: helix-turn-helix domain-containing protein [Ruminococcus sp.]